MEKIKILILAANPADTFPLALAEEFQHIQDLLDNAKDSEQFIIRYYPALHGEHIQKKVLSFKPHIIHFSGHGNVKGLAFMDSNGENTHLVGKDALADLFKLCKPHLKAVLLNACHTSEQAEEIFEQVDYVIGIDSEINDLAAIEFAKGFYSMIFTQSSLDIASAFAAGRSQMELNKWNREQHKFNLYQPSYVGFYQYDVAIDFITEDEEWTKKFADDLLKKLENKLKTKDQLKFYCGTDLNKLNKSAILLLIISPDYINYHKKEEHRISHLAENEMVIMVELDAIRLPISLEKLARHKFWRDDDDRGVVLLNRGKPYSDKLDELAIIISENLSKLKIQNTAKKKIISIPFPPITYQKLEDSGFLQVFADLFMENGVFNRDEARNFLKYLKFPPAYLPNSKMSKDFWQRVCRQWENTELAEVMPIGGLDSLLQEILVKYNEKLNALYDINKIGAVYAIRE